ncbi:DNA polymerase V [Lachnospiraceae bacterium A10]|nr:DNA polymerase V [Lachnospiraceae bacterium A10]
MEEKRERQYICIDLKSFYASVECSERGLDALTTNLVVADPERTEKTICLAVSPALKAYGIPGRARLFEVLQAVKQVNRARLYQAPGGRFTGKSANALELKENPALELDFVIAPPQMAKYIEVSSGIYRIYLKYVAPEDIHVYSIDEVFMDVTTYLKAYGMSAHELAMKMIREVLETTGITATAGIGTNPYLGKVAMDIVAKHMPADKDGVRIAELDEMSYRELLWNHRPLTDFWRVGAGYRRKLESKGLYTMGDIARCSLENEEILYQMFGVNAELLIDHAWGIEPCDISMIKAYKPKENSISTGQVLQCAYTAEKGRLIVKEMTDLLVLDLVDKHLVTDQVVLTIGYDIENLTDEARRKKYHGEVYTDYYGRVIPKPAHGTGNMDGFTSSTKKIMKTMMELYDRIVDPNLLVRRITIVANHTIPEGSEKAKNRYEQMDLFQDFLVEEKPEEKEQNIDPELESDKERRVQNAILEIQKRYGKNALLKGMNLEEGAMTRERNNQIGGHKA